LKSSICTEVIVNINCQAAFLILLAVLVSASADCRAEEQTQRSITRLSGDLYRAQNDQHFTVFLVTRDGIVLADPINREFSAWLKNELEERFRVPVRYVLYSHHHWDHASGGAVFADTAQFVGHENMLPRLSLPPSDTPLPAEAALLDGNDNGAIEAAEAKDNLQRNFANYDADGNGTLNGAEILRGPVSDVQVPDITYKERTSVSLGGRTVELTWTGPITHTDDMSVIRFPDESSVFVVDFISIKTMPFRTLGPDLLDEWLGAIRAVEAMDFSTVSPGHGVVGGKRDVAEHRQYLEDLRDAVAQGIESGQSVDEMQKTVQLTRYKDWFMYDEWRALNVAGMYELLQQQ
jgi:glyoxylase-like metal-dependent hydrolase (beta-lactamase superfamily II)